MFRPEEPQTNDVIESQSPVAEPSEVKEITTDSTEDPRVEENEEKAVSYEVDLADIQLPATEFVENPPSIQEVTNEVVEAMVEDSSAVIAPSQEEVQTPIPVEVTDTVNMAEIEQQPVLDEEKQPNLT